MAVDAVDPQLLEVALERASGAAFEDFVNEFAAALMGADYVPVGGTADGGADGFVAEHLLESRTRPDDFLQTSVEKTVQSKIRRTVNRLREVGRVPRALTYFSSQRVANSEQIEYDLGTELNLIVRIRDQKYIAVHINHSVHTRAAFGNHLRHFTDFLKKIGASKVIAPSSHVRHPDVYVFLRQELDRREGKTSLVDAVVDSLIVWALEVTDPGRDVYMTRNEIREKIVRELPSAKIYVDSRLDQRLEQIAKKRNPGGRLIRWHSKNKNYVLPYETRERIALDNASDEALMLGMRESLRERLFGILPESANDEDADREAAIVLKSLQIAFEKEGLDFAHFVTREADQVASSNYISDAVALAMDEHGIAATERDLVGDRCLETLRQVFYDSRSVERDYLERLGRTYAILFTLQSEPRLIEYFEEMRSSFHLYVGSDILIRALSERYLAEEDQATRNMLRIASATGADLVLAEPILEEVVSHLRATDFEFRNYVEPSENHVTSEIARQSSRILIRAYLYAKLGMVSGGSDPPGNWPSYIGQFCDRATLHRPAGMSEVRRYLQSQFGLSFEPRKALEELVSMREVAELAEQLSAVKKSPELADNDALMCHAVYARRDERAETAGVSEFGYATWWLTQGETAILRFTKDLSDLHHGDRFIMRPEFLLNFISLSPSAADARNTFKHIFPSVLGVRLARRMNQEEFHKLMEKVREASALEDGRRQAKISQMSDALKSDMRRQYSVSFRPDGATSQAEWIRTSALEP